VEKYGQRWQATGDNIIQGMRFACCITKVTEAHLECVILAFPRQYRLRESTSLFLYSYTAGLVNLDSRWWWLVNFGPGPFNLWKIAPNGDRAGGWVTEAIWRTEERRTYSYWKSNHEFLVVHLVLQSLISEFKLSLLLITFCRCFREGRIYLSGCESRHIPPPPPPKKKKKIKKEKKGPGKGI